MGNVARVTEITARSENGWEDAVQVGIDRANQTLRNVESAWVKELKVECQDGRITSYHVDMLVTFILDDGQDIGESAAGGGSA